MVVFPNSKINLGLYITEKRSDGFHNIETCFVPIGWNDVLEITPADEFSFKSSGIPIPGIPEENLCVKAYEIVAEKYDIPPVRIHLHKVVPIGAGLGGGSSDASFTLTALNELFALDLSTKELESFAAKLGSDCPFFIQNKICIATGRGEILEPITVDFSGMHFIVINPGVHIGTKEAYSLVKPKIPDNPLKNSLLNSDPGSWENSVFNDFEEGIFKNHPEIENLKKLLYSKGAQYAAMSGSGSSVFGIFDSIIDTDEIATKEFDFWTGQIQS